jgi:hypothetical protein
MYTDKNRIACQKWRSKNREKSNAYCASLMKEQYEKNKDKKKQYENYRYYMKQELKIFLRILIEDIPHS